MIDSSKFKQLIVLFLIAFSTSSCAENPQHIVLNSTTESSESDHYLPFRDSVADQSKPIAEYIVDIFEDSRGVLWFGTMSRGAIRYDPKATGKDSDPKLTYLTSEDGLPGNTVVNIIEDAQGHLWLATHSGLSMYDGEIFRNFTTADGLCHDRVSGVTFDKKGLLYVLTWDGICTFDGQTFTDFHVPYPDIEEPLNPDTKDWVTTLTTDKKGNIWIARDGYGACRFDGENFTHFTKEDGLLSNNVQSILLNDDGKIYFGTRVAERDLPNPINRFGPGGLSLFDGEEMTYFQNQPGLYENDVYSISKDRSGNLWISAVGVGIYRYDGQSFTVFTETNRMDLTYSFSMQSMLEDRNGNIWLGFSGGLFRLEGNAIVHVGEDHGIFD